jgi:hypothetical protein
LDAGNAASPEPPCNPPWTSGPSPVLLPGAPAEVRVRISREPAHTPKPSPAAAPAFKGRRTAGSRTPLHAVVLPMHAPAPERPPALARAARPCAAQQFPQSLPTAQHHRALPSRPERHQAEGCRGQPPGAPPAAVPRRYPTHLRPQNRTLVLPRSFPRPSPAARTSELAGFCPPAPGSRPGDYIANTKFFPGSLLQKVNSNSKTLWLVLVNFVENHRKIIQMQDQFCGVRGKLFYNFCYSGLS